jgi:hypothetical protein
VLLLVQTYTKDASAAMEKAVPFDVELAGAETSLSGPLLPKRFVTVTRTVLVEVEFDQFAMRVSLADRPVFVGRSLVRTDSSATPSPHLA